MNSEELGRYIRFQLAQLTTRNEHHRFEDLCRQFARLRISEQIIPATGPVGAGGDGGKDFETYRTYLESSPIAASTFLSRKHSNTLVFACSLAKSIDSKIKTDLKTLCKSSHPVKLVYYFCEASIPIGKRNLLIQHAKEKHGVELTVLDGQAIAEGLTSPEMFWLAQQYLDVSAEVYPKPLDSDDAYAAIRGRWIERGAHPSSFADFIDLKSGLRRATRDPQRRSDLPKWLHLMGDLKDAVLPLRRRAIYEICVAALRGLNDLTARSELIAEYFGDIESLRDPVEIQDAVVLLSYCSTAAVQGHLEIPAATLHTYSVALISTIDAQLKTEPPVGRRCELLETRGIAEVLWFRSGVVPKLNPGGLFGYWQKLLKLVPNAPLFPLESFADALTKLAPHFASDSRFDALVQKTDKLLEKRTSGHVAAEKCRDRAVALLESNDLLQAIRQLHLTKIKWFSAETVGGSVRAASVLCDCYLKLGLVYAAKQSAAAAVVLASRSDNDDVKRLLADCLLSLFRASYSGGEWFTCVRIAGLVFATQNAFVQDAYDIEKNPGLMQVFCSLSLIRAFSYHLNSGASDIERICSDWPIHESVREVLDDLTRQARSRWDDEKIGAIRKRGESELWGRPFLDLGRRRIIHWNALGVQWTVSFDNERETVALCEEFLAALQVIQADLGTTDLVLLPTSVEVDAYLTPQADMSVEEVPSNDRARWRIGFPRAWLDSNRDQRHSVPSIVAIAATLLGKCTVLDANEFQARLKKAMKEGLFDKTAFVRPYAHLYLELISKEDFSRAVLEKLSPLIGMQDFENRHPEQLSWRKGDAPGYSKLRAQEFLRNRYDRVMGPIRHTLPRLLADAVIGPKILALRERGMKDWEILLLVLNRVVSYRVSLRNPKNMDEQARLMQELINAEDEESAVPIPVEVFDDDNIEVQFNTGIASVAQTWGLHLHRHTPDFDALRKLLVARFHLQEDDVSHDDVLTKHV